MGARKRKQGRRSATSTSSSSEASAAASSAPIEGDAEPSSVPRLSAADAGASQHTVSTPMPSQTSSVWACGGDPAVKPRGPALWGLNLFIGLLLFLLTVDAMPNSIPGIGRLDAALDPVVDIAGLSQGDWKLFSPDPDHINAYVEAVITYSDGSTQRWTTYEWRNRSLLDKFFQGRHPKFADAFRMDRNKVIWPYLADYILTQLKAPPGAHATQIELLRHWWEVPLPKDLPEETKKFRHMPPWREEFPHQYSFYTKKLDGGR